MARSGGYDTSSQKGPGNARCRSVRQASRCCQRCARGGPVRAAWGLGASGPTAPLLEARGQRGKTGYAEPGSFSSRFYLQAATAAEPPPTSRNAVPQEPAHQARARQEGQAGAEATVAPGASVSARGGGGTSLERARRRPARSAAGTAGAAPLLGRGAAERAAVCSVGGGRDDMPGCGRQAGQGGRDLGRCRPPQNRTPAAAPPLRRRTAPSLTGSGSAPVRRGGSHAGFSSARCSQLAAGLGRGDGRPALLRTVCGSRGGRIEQALTPSSLPPRPRQQDPLQRQASPLAPHQAGHLSSPQLWTAARRRGGRGRKVAAGAPAAALQPGVPARLTRRCAPVPVINGPGSRSGGRGGASLRLGWPAPSFVPAPKPVGPRDVGGPGVPILRAACEPSGSLHQRQTPVVRGEQNASGSHGQPRFWGVTREPKFSSLGVRCGGRSVEERKADDHEGHRQPRHQPHARHRLCKVHEQAALVEQQDQVVEGGHV